MKRVIALILAVALCMGLYVFASSETVVSLSYLNNTIKPQVEKDIESQVKAMFKAPTNISEELFSQGGMISDVAKRVLERMQMKGYYMYSTTGREEVVLKKGDVLSGLSGTTFIMRDGSASVINDAIINLTKGEEIKAGAAIPQSTNFMIPTSNGAGIKINSDRARVWVDGVYRVVSLRYRAKNFDRADALKTMNFFRGSDIGYELDRGATRTEALVMLLRLLGEEEEALAFNGEMPFTDVPAWAKNYVAYAYDKGYTKGVSETKFASNELTTANQYMTFLLRALGYDDENGDFIWNRALDFAKSNGDLTEGEFIQLATSNFLRDHLAYISYQMLFAKMKDGDVTLLDKLIESGVVTEDAARAGIAKVTTPRL